MCGIFGFALAEAVGMDKVFKVLERLEVHQYPNEAKPLGGYGAGVAILNDDGFVACEKKGKSEVSPVKALSEAFKIKQTRVLMGHVRMPSPEFMNTARFKETTQPYVVESGGVTVISVHNKKVENYKELRAGLGVTQVFESERVGKLVDSEVIPHVFVELLREKHDVNEALNGLFEALNGSNTVALMQLSNDYGNFLHFMHKGKTRGLMVWSNDAGEVVFASRKEPLAGVFDDVLTQGNFKQKVRIRWQENANVKLSFPLNV